MSPLAKRSVLLPGLNADLGAERCPQILATLGGYLVFVADQTQILVDSHRRVALVVSAGALQNPLAHHITISHAAEVRVQHCAVDLCIADNLKLFTRD